MILKAIRRHSWKVKRLVSARRNRNRMTITRVIISLLIKMKVELKNRLNLS